MLQAAKYKEVARLDLLGDELVLAIQSRSIDSVLSLMVAMQEQLDPARDMLHIRYLKRVYELISFHGLAKVPRWEDTELEQLIAKGAFMDHRGRVLFIAPAGQRRSGCRYSPELTAIYGSCQEVSVSFDGSRRILLEGLITDDQFDTLAFVPFIPKCVAGLLTESTDEYFVPGGFWRIGSERKESGIPAFLNVESVRLAAERVGKYLVYEIFDAKSARALTAWLSDPLRAQRLIALEYLKHEYGHALSHEVIQLARSESFKRDRLRRLAAYAHDESRADGTSESEFFKQYITGSDEERDLYAVTVMVRILDLARAANKGEVGSIPLDVDVLTALKWWEQLTLGGTLYKHRKGNKLGLTPQYAWEDGEINTDPLRREVNMLQVIWPMRTWARRVEADEKLCSNQAQVEDLVLRNRVGPRMRDAFVRDLLQPISTLVRRTRDKSCPFRDGGG